MRDQLSQQPANVETGIINLDNNTGHGTHGVAIPMDPRLVIYFDSNGLEPPKGFLKYIARLNIRCWYSTLPTQTHDGSSDMWSRGY